MNALFFLSEMVYPPYPIAERIHKKMVAGGYASEDDFFIEMEKLVYDQIRDMHIFYFPKSQSLPDEAVGFFDLCVNDTAFFKRAAFH